jgi:predicted ATP-dependent protease
MAQQSLDSQRTRGEALTDSAPSLPADRLRWRCDVDLLNFASTDDIPPLDGTVGQDRGVEAIGLGLALDADGFNLYIAGPSGSGRATTARGMIERLAAGRPPAWDWCYLHNFPEPSQPLAIQLATGQDRQLARDLDELIVNCRREIPRVFEGEQYHQRRATLAQELQERRDALFGQVRAKADQLGFAVEFSPMGIHTMPLLEPGKPLTPEAFELLTEEKQVEIRGHAQELARRTEEILLSVRRVEREAHERLHALDREVVSFAVGHLFDALRASYARVEQVIEHLNRIQADLVSHLDEFRGGESDAGAAPLGVSSESAFERYRVNVLVGHDSETGAPVVFEPNPTFYNLVGKIDYRASMGAMYTDFRFVRSGALHRANGGYLILQARDVLLSPFAWDALKRALRDRELRIENLGEQFSAFPTATLKPEPIPLDVKVVLIGDVQTYMLLYGLDPDFARLFKVKAQFGPYMNRSPETVRAYAGFVSGRVRAHDLLPFTVDAVGRVVEYGARLAEHQERLATRFEAIDDLLIEASYAARTAGSELVHAAHVATALAARDRRLGLLEDEIQREIDEGTIAIATHGDVVAQVNALSVLDLGDYAFARPSRITASVGLGEEGVVDIEREVKLSGPTHSKGVMILSGYLLEQCARSSPLALSARLTFEQTYGEVDGDSASSAELYALLSALAEAPIRQGVAVTGSVNQRGEIQAVGGVTTKIEGFFAVCKAQGLDGRQGVVIPATNARHLMLKQEVVDAVAAGRFHVWTVRTVDEGIELLTGLPAGARRTDGRFGEGVHARVQQRLQTLGTRLVEFRRNSQKSTPSGHRTGHAGVPVGHGESGRSR